MSDHEKAPGAANARGQVMETMTESISPPRAVQRRLPLAFGRIARGRLVVFVVVEKETVH